MSLRAARGVLVATFALLATGPLVASDDPPLTSWAIPKVSGRLAPLTDVGQPSIFISMAPCRIVDTRGGAPLGGGAGKFTNGQTRDYDLNSAAAPCNGIPSGTTAYSVNVTVTNDTGNGFIAVYPTSNPPNPLVSLLNYKLNSAVANATIVPCDSNGSVTVLNQGAQTDVIIDINGYYIGGNAILNPGERLVIQGSFSGDALIFGSNLDTAGGPPNYGAFLSTWGTGSASAGVYANASAVSSRVYGAIGQVQSTADYSAGLFGLSQGASGVNFGIWALAGSPTQGAAGLLAEAGNVTYPINGGPFGVRGVVGASVNTGVLGITTGYPGVEGLIVDGTGASLSGGVLGYTSTYGVFSYENVGAVGTKTFVEPHPTDPGKQIVYIAMEGPEAGTYFRGRGRFAGKTATIEVPEDFRLVTEAEGITVQITPIGPATAVGVTGIGLDRIDVESTRDVEFSYLVQGIRRNYRDHQPIQKNTLFVPAGPGARMEPYPPHIQKRLIDLGIYNEDGTVNMQTAERMGWAHAWRDAVSGSAEKPIVRR